MNKKPIKIWLIVCLLLLSNETIYAQFKPKAYRFVFANEAVALPTNNPFAGPIHPLSTIWIDYNVKNKGRWQRTLGIDLGYFHQRLSENSVMLDATYANGIRFGKIITQIFSSNWLQAFIAS